MNRLANLRCLVTAAGQGIGRETALRFAAEGATVLAVDISTEKLSDLVAATAGIEARMLDVRDPQAVALLGEARPAFDVVFNCVGYVHHGTILDCDEADWRRSFELNVDSMYRICRAVLPAMIEQGRGSIINVSSVASSVSGVPLISCRKPRMPVMGVRISCPTTPRSSDFRSNASTAAWRASCSSATWRRSSVTS